MKIMGMERVTGLDTALERIPDDERVEYGELDLELEESRRTATWRLPPARVAVVSSVLSISLLAGTPFDASPGFVTSETPHPPRPSEEAQNLEAKFSALADEWEHATAHKPLWERFEDPRYQAIIEMGSAVVPYILKRLERRPGHWAHALTQITGENPIRDEDAGRMKKIAKTWLEWGHERGLVA